MAVVAAVAVPVAVVSPLPVAPPWLGAAAVVVAAVVPAPRVRSYEEMLALGMIDAQQAQTHPGQYQLTKAVTAYDPAAPEPTTTAVAPRGRLLLCSDGLTSELCDETIARLLAQGSPDDAADALLAAALRAPARDNVSVVVVDLG